MRLDSRALVVSIAATSPASKAKDGRLAPVSLCWIPRYRLTFAGRAGIATNASTGVLLVAIQVMQDVWQHSSATGSRLLVLLAIADAADRQTRIAYPGLEFLSQYARLKKRQALAHIEALITTGELERVAAGHQGQRASYRVLVGADPRTLMGAAARTLVQSEGCSPAQREGAVQRQNRVQAPAPLPTTEPTTEPTAMDIMGNGDDFAAFWGAYPKRAGSNPRKAAETAYRARRRDGVSVDELLAGVQRYAAFCTATGKTGTEYVKQAQFWLGPRYEGWAQAWDVPKEVDEWEQARQRIRAREGKA